MSAFITTSAGKCVRSPFESLHMPSAAPGSVLPHRFKHTGIYCSFLVWIFLFYAINAIFCFIRQTLDRSGIWWKEWRFHIVCFSSQECLFLKHLKVPLKRLLFLLSSKKQKTIEHIKEAVANMKNEIETFCPGLSTMSPVVFSVLREAPRIAVLVRSLVQDIKYKPIMLNLKQLFPALKNSLLTFLTASCVFSNTFLCLHFLSFRFLSLHSSRLHLGESKWEAKRGIFAPRIKTRGSLKHIWRNTFLNWAGFVSYLGGHTVFHHILCVYTSPTSCGLYLPIYSYYRNGSCLNHTNISSIFFYLSRPLFHHPALVPVSLPHSLAVNLGSSVCHKYYNVNDSISHLALTSWGGGWWCSGVDSL